MDKKSFFVDVLLPLALPQSYTYALPPGLVNDIAVGKRVIVQFGARRYYTALVSCIHHKAPQHHQAKEVISVLDHSPIVADDQIKFWEWMAAYYMCTPGEVFKAALPSGLKLESETKIIYSEGFEDKNAKLSSKEMLTLDILKDNHMMRVSDLAGMVEFKDVLSVVKALIDKGAVVAEEKIRERYKPKTKKYIRLADGYKNETALKTLFDELGKAPKQLKLLMTYLHVTGYESNSEAKKVAREELIKKSEVSKGILDAMIKKKVFDVYEQEIGRIEVTRDKKETLFSLSKIQQKAFLAIKKKFTEKDVVLLHGVTSSGKTEIYIHLINEQIKKGKQVLYLLPEIALTTQIINRLKSVFGKIVGVYHSKFSDAERVETWNRVLNDKKKDTFQLIIGVRSSVFLPFKNLGLIIVDEEHENTYKQFDPAPRYHARDTAVYLAKQHGASVLLGTATPSVESYYNVQNGKYALVELNERFRDVQMPEMVVVDMKKAYKKRQVKAHFSTALIEKMEEALDNDEQVILFQNRRGFSPYVQCNTCGWIPQCKYCDVSLTYHKHINRVICHYCGYSIRVPGKCEACGSTGVQTKGFGTEKVEDEINLLFPEAKTIRMDMDTTRTRKKYEQIIYDFSDKKIDILIGTQMISKGLNFDHVHVAGILNADNMLNFPDFRAFERSFQLMTQVSGRAGRLKKRGIVLIQTHNPQHPVINNVLNYDYQKLFVTQLSERRQYKYPPYYRLIRLIIKHKKRAVLDDAASQLADKLKMSLGWRVLGPQYPVVNRIQNWYIKNILIKIEKDKTLHDKKEFIAQAGNLIQQHHKFKSLQIIYDVDPF